MTAVTFGTMAVYGYVTKRDLTRFGTLMRAGLIGQPVHPKGDQSWVFIGRTDVEAETPILWPPDANS